MSDQTETTETATAPLTSAERRARDERLAAVLILPKGTELERATLGRLADIAAQAMEIRAREGEAAYARHWRQGICDAFDALALERGRDEARAAFDWAIHRMWATMCAVRPVRPTDDA